MIVNKEKIRQAAVDIHNALKNYTVNEALNGLELFYLCQILKTNDPYLILESFYVRMKQDLGSNITAERKFKKASESEGKRGVQ